MHAVHLRIEGTTRDSDMNTVESALRMVAGVIHVIVVRSMALVSVLYDETVADAARILAAVRDAGFKALPEGAATPSAH